MAGIRAAIALALHYDVRPHWTLQWAAKQSIATLPWTVFSIVRFASRRSQRGNGSLGQTTSFSGEEVAG